MFFKKRPTENTVHEQVVVPVGMVEGVVPGDRAAAGEGRQEGHQAGGSPEVGMVHFYFEAALEIFTHNKSSYGKVCHVYHLSS